MQQLMLPKHVDLAEGLRATPRLNMSVLFRIERVPVVYQILRFKQRVRNWGRRQAGVGKQRSFATKSDLAAG